MPKLAHVRIELTDTAKEAAEALCKRHGMMQYSLLSRLVEWFVSQDETIHFAVLAAIPAELRTDVAKLLLARRGRD
jgi:hypothetical protein